MPDFLFLSGQVSRVRVKAKHRLAQFHGLAKHTFALYLKESEFIFNQRHQNIYLALLKVLRDNPL